MGISRKTTHTLRARYNELTVADMRAFVEELPAEAKLRISSYAGDRPGDIGEDIIEVTEEIE